MGIGLYIKTSRGTQGNTPTYRTHYRETPSGIKGQRQFDHEARHTELNRIRTTTMTHYGDPTLISDLLAGQADKYVWCMCVCVGGGGGSGPGSVRYRRCLI